MSRLLRACVAATALGALPAAAGAMPVLQHVEAQRGTSADRLVFTFRGGLPATVRTFAVTRVTQDGSGAPVAVRGRAFRQVVFSMAHAHDSSYRPSCAPRTVTPTLDLVVQARMAGDFEGQVTYGVGLTRQVRPAVVRRPSARQIVLVFRR
ncbi:MAG: hypothetical protein KDC33_01775 [Thermoleophilia bacterium]|nr:hypothetical protein [Thermoleophilia bacterium]